MEHYVGLDVSLKETAICVTGLTLGGSKNQRLRSEERSLFKFGLIVETSRSCGSRGRAMRRQQQVPIHPALRSPSLNSPRWSANRNG